MDPFRYVRVERPQQAVEAASASTQFLAGGTTLLDLMKLGVMRPEALIELSPLQRTAMGQIHVTREGLWIGALVKMADAAEHPAIKRDYPVIAQSLSLAASQQLRNMASVGGNVLQRTRCAYFRDLAVANCNKRQPGSGCAALTGHNRLHAVLGTSSQCIATYPGDFAQALLVLDAYVSTLWKRGDRYFRFARLHDTSPEAPHIETQLKHNEMITAFVIPPSAHHRRSAYVKVRDRASYAFALAAAAVALDLEGDRVRDVRIALGGVATRPWRATDAESVLMGTVLDEQGAFRAAEAAFATARTSEHNAFKVPLAQQAMVQALMQARQLELRA